MNGVLSFGSRSTTRRAAAATALALAAVAAPAAVQAQKGQSSADPATGGAIQGYVYYDADGDGAFGPDESAVVGVPVRLDGPEGGDTAATNAEGLYQFTGLGPGRYRVAVDTSALAVLLGSAEGLDVPGYDALAVTSETLTGVNFALDGDQVATLSAALAKAVAAVQAALPGSLPGAAPPPVVGAAEGLTATAVAEAIAANSATAATTATTAATATTSATATLASTPTAATAVVGSKGGRQMGAAAPTTTTASAAAMTETAALTTTMAATTGLASAAAGAEAGTGAPDGMPGGGLGDVFGATALAGLAAVLGLLGGFGALRRRGDTAIRG